jgi:hypothetical protein
MTCPISSDSTHPATAAWMIARNGRIPPSVGLAIGGVGGVAGSLHLGWAFPG